MATKKMKTPGTPAASSTRRSPLAPSALNPAPSGLPFDDASSRVVKGTLVKRGGAGVGASDAALGMRTSRPPRQTTAGAQYRVGFSLPGAVAPEARPTLANGRVVPPVMGSKQRTNFDAQRRVMYG